MHDKIYNSLANSLLTLAKIVDFYEYQDIVINEEELHTQIKKDLISGNFDDYKNYVNLIIYENSADPGTLKYAEHLLYQLDNIHFLSKEFPDEIDNKEHKSFKLQLLTDKLAVYINLGEDILVMDLQKNQMFPEKDGLKMYYETMNAILNESMDYIYGDRLVAFCAKRNRIYPERVINKAKSHVC